VEKESGEDSGIITARGQDIPVLPSSKSQSKVIERERKEKKMKTEMIDILDRLQVSENILDCGENGRQNRR